jgi:gliding motility-associated-like protein
MWSGIGKNFVTRSSDVTPDDHGTHVAGIIAAVTNNGTGVAGIAGGSGGGNGIRLMSCQIFEGDNSAQDIGEAITYAADNGAVICQNSWGYDKAGEYNQSELDAIQYFIDYAGKDSKENARPGTKMQGGIVIFAAGNDGSDDHWYPAYLDYVTAVSAIGYTGKRAHYSNYGSWVDIAAPGGDSNHGRYGTILSTLPTNSSYSPKEGAGYGWMQGTSMACPHVSGVAALVLSKYGNPGYTPDMLRKRLIDSTRSLTAYDPTYASRLGKGLVDARKALWGSIVHASSVTIDNCLTEVSRGATWTLSATVLPDITTDKRVTFTSDDPAIVELSEQGGQVIAFGKALGQTSITATTVDGGLEAVCHLTVVIPVDSVSLEPRVMRLKMGCTATATATIMPHNAGNKNVIWESDNPGVARVDNGVVTGFDGGSTGNPKKAIIKVTTENGSHTKTMEVYVHNDIYIPEGFSPDGDGINDHFKFTVDPGENYSLQVFDRSGQVHFRSADFQREYPYGWGGNANTGPYSGNRLPANTYLYILSVKNSGEVKKGFVVIKYSR